ncbi:uncharacterized protein [Solanum lycopersicum]|uniref:uncharacterized protein n=1 Tax=Solanum lycopersicum TaxID=4081 RepID=UPI000276B9F6
MALNLKEQDKAINTEEEIPVHLRNAPSTKASEKEQDKAINTEKEMLVQVRNAPSTKASENEKGKSIVTGTAEERPVHKLKRPGSVSHLWVKNYFSFPSTAYRKNEKY